MELGGEIGGRWYGPGGEGGVVRAVGGEMGGGMGVEIGGEMGVEMGGAWGAQGAPWRRGGRLGALQNPIEPYRNPLGSYRDPLGPYRDPRGPYGDPPGLPRTLQGSATPLTALEDPIENPIEPL